MRNPGTLIQFQRKLIEYNNVGQRTKNIAPQFSILIQTKMPKSHLYRSDIVCKIDYVLLSCKNILAIGTNKYLERKNSQRSLIDDRTSECDNQVNAKLQ